MERFDRAYLRKLRYALQWGLLVFIIYGGYRLYLFREHFISGTRLVERPPLVDGFLPIGALMGLKLWILKGVFDPVHPAALVIFLSAMAVSLALKKSFCGWLCPVGTLSEVTYKIGKTIFGRNLKMPKYLDYPLRSVKYILLGSFAYVVLKMPAEGIIGFLGTPYWKAADVKMLEFFIKMSSLTLYVLISLFALSFVFKNFWCRYLCPYGALLGIMSFLSPLKITRNNDACIHCGACTRNCPSLLPVDEKSRVNSPECTGCLTCVSRCPTKGALDMSLPSGKPLRPVIYAVLVSALFFGIVFAAKLTGRWQSNVTTEEYKAIVPIASQLGHP